MADSEEEYLEKAIVFLKKVQWMFNFKNTEILTKNVLSHFSADQKKFCDSISVQDLHSFVRGELENIPLGFRDIIHDIHLLSSDQEAPRVDVKPIRALAGVSKKKLHEITLFAPIVREECTQVDCDLIVDIGSGVGHLSNLLHTTYNYPVLALETSIDLVQTGRATQSKTIIFEQLFVTASSAPAIEALILKHFGPNRRACLIGLHACADLSVDVLHLFQNLSSAKALAIMPCCYHRLKSRADGFENFPASEVGLRLFGKHKAYLFLGQPFLRLACQQTLASFVAMDEREHLEHAERCLQRAVLEFVAEKENCTVRRLRRKSGGGRFDTYLNNLKMTHELVVRTPTRHLKISDAAFLDAMREKWTETRKEWRQVEVLMGLQAAIQRVCERVLLHDRAAFLKEKGFRCHYRKITNDSVSPRSWALVSNKQ